MVHAIEASFLHGSSHKSRRLSTLIVTSRGFFFLLYFLRLTPRIGRGRTTTAHHYFGCFIHNQAAFVDITFRCRQVCPAVAGGGFIRPNKNIVKYDIAKNMIWFVMTEAALEAAFGCMLGWNKKCLTRVTRVRFFQK